ncbi:MAG TPA: glycosyltransferase family 4 protein [Candidatus Saccharimonadales bacterium]|nr:glycosyltransferase family 4 protein [Candidatus Saccharimonadales bacterium]
MKIGLVLPYNITLGGGVKEHVFAQQNELTRRGHDVVVVTPQPREAYVPDGRKVAFLGSATELKTPLGTASQISASILTDEIDALLEREAFDILHFHEPGVPVLSRQILSRSNTVNVATFHALWPETVMSRTMAKVVRPYTKPLVRHINAFTAVTEGVAKYVRTLADVPIAIIPNGIDLKHFKKPSKLQRNPAQPKTIFYVGRLEQRKGVQYLLRAVAQLQQQWPDVHLVIAGDGVDRQKLEAEADELGLKHTDFLGFIDEATKKRLLHSADLACYPAIFGESFGIVLLEAMASGLVTVAGDNPGYASVMQELGRLSLVNPKDTLQFAHRLELLLFDEDLRAIWKKWAKEYVKQFDYTHIVDRYEAVYKKALAAARKNVRKRK